MSLRRACASALISAVMFSACSGARTTSGRTRVNDGWSVDALPEGSSGRRLYNEVGGQSRVVDKDVVWARPANECVLYEVFRNKQRLVYAAHTGKTPVVVGAADQYSSWYPDDNGFRHYEIREEGARHVVDEEEINPNTACVAASKGQPFTDDWVWTASADVVVAPERRSFDVNDEAGGGVTRLHMAVFNRQPGLIEVLLKAGFDVNAGDKRGRTALMAATGSAVPTAILRQLLRAKAIVDATDNEGMTALMHAVHGHAIEHAKILLDHGASLTLRNAAGQTPLDLAARSTDRMKKLLADATPRQ